MPATADGIAAPRSATPGWLLALGAAYGVAWGLSRLFLWLATDVAGHAIAPLPDARLPLFMAGFAAFFLPLLYFAASALAGRWLRPDWPKLVLTMGTTFLCAMWLEIAADTLFVWTLGRPCWIYHVWPVHGGYTSGFGLLMWPMYGVFLHLLHLAIDINPRLAPLRSHGAKAVLAAVDAMLLEVAANAFALVGFGSYLFHYHAGDLAHFTTWEVFLPYVVSGWLGLHVLHGLHALERRLPPVATGVALYALALAGLRWM